MLEDDDGGKGTSSSMSKSFSEEELEALRAGTTDELKVVADTERAVLRGARSLNECIRGSGRADALQRAWMIARDMAGFESGGLCSSNACSNHLGTVLNVTNRTGAFVSSRERGSVSLCVGNFSLFLSFFSQFPDSLGLAPFFLLVSVPARAN